MNPIHILMLTSLYYVNKILGWAQDNGTEEIQSLERDLFNSRRDITFYLYTKNNVDPQQILMGNERSLVQVRSYNSSWPSIFVTHGHGGSRNDESVAVIKAAYNFKGEYNVIVVDWSKYASLFYPLSIMYVKEIGAKVAKMADLLMTDYGVDPEDITFVGHSLGGHIVGSAGKQTSRKIGRIVGLDPAGPMFGSSSDSRISKNDAKVVEIIHTCGSLFGLHEAVGHVDFYPNGGRYQIGCENEYPRCDHFRSYHLYAEALRKPDTLVGVKCSSYNVFTSNECKKTNTLSMAFKNSDKLVEGNYYLRTNREQPFGMGLRGIKSIEITKETSSD